MGLQDSWTWFAFWATSSFGLFVVYAYYVRQVYGFLADANLVTTAKVHPAVRTAD